MKDDTVFRILAVALFVAGAAIRLYHQWQARRHGGPIQPRPEPIAFWLGIMLVSLVMLLSVTAFLLNPPWAAWGQVALPRGLRWAGAGIDMVAIALAVWVLHHLGPNLTRTAGVRANARLITSGPYRWVRHPIYSVATAGWAGFGLMIASWPVLASAVLLIPLLALRIRSEEAALIERFGDEYREYMRTTGRLFPRLT